MAGGLGFEPRLAESESAVLPLDDPPVVGTGEKIQDKRAEVKSVNVLSTAEPGVPCAGLLSCALPYGHHG